MFDFNSMLTWKLRRGSHEFPGPDGGTCINEAAVVAAGLEYRTIASPDDCPPCFSRPIAEYALCLNDSMPSYIRQKLLTPFVLRLAGTADSEKIEIQREQLIIFATLKYIVPTVFQEWRDRTVFEDYLQNKAAKEISEEKVAKARQTEYLLCYCTDRWLIEDAQDASNLAAAIASVLRRPMPVYKQCVAILDRAILLGNHHELAAPVAIKRMTKARALQYVSD